MTDGKTTETGIDCLERDARVDEVARMLGGVDITEQTRRHAQEMIGAQRRGLSNNTPVRPFVGTIKSLLLQL